MNKLRIKICGVTSPLIAEKAVISGADFIGIVFYYFSKRCVDINLAKEIAHATISHGATPVAVFVNHDAKTMEKICLDTGITTIQLHGKIARANHHRLPKAYVRLYVKLVSADGKIYKDHTHGLSHCDPLRDYLLFDHINSGQGQIFNWHNFHYRKKFSFGLAGGLNTANIADAIKRFNLQLIDVSSGVESKPGKKSIGKIIDFITTVRQITGEFNDTL